MGQWQIDLKKYPSFEVTLEKRIPYFVGLGLLFLFGYLFTNRYHFGEPHHFDTLGIENLVPFLPWTVWIYVSDYFFPFLVGFMIKDSLLLTRYAAGFVLMTAICLISFYFFPVHYPRDLFPLPVEHSPVLTLVRYIDTPANCFPSAHVAIVWISVAALFRQNRKWTPFFVVWGTAICISTLTTKQHYFADVIAGTVLGLGSFLVGERVVVKSH